MCLARHNKHLALFNTSDSYFSFFLYSAKQVCKVLKKADFALSACRNKMG